MKLGLQTLLWLLALLCFIVKFILTAANGSDGKIDLMAAGMTFFVAGFLFG